MEKGLKRFLLCLQSALPILGCMFLHSTRSKEWREYSIILILLRCLCLNMKTSWEWAKWELDTIYWVIALFPNLRLCLSQICNYKASPSMGFSRQEYWNGLPFSSPGDLPNPGIKPGSPVYRLSHQGSPRNLTNFFLHDLKSPILDQWLLIFIGNTWDKRCSYRRPILMVYPELRHFSKLRKQF